MTIDRKVVPQLPGKVSVGRAEEILGRSRNTIYFYMFESPRYLNKVHRLDTGGDQSVYVLDLQEVLELRAYLQHKDALQPATTVSKDGVREANRVIKQWGRENGFEVKPSGPVPVELRRAYDAAHPEQALNS